MCNKIEINREIDTKIKELERGIIDQAITDKAINERIYTLSNRYDRLESAFKKLITSLKDSEDIVVAEAEIENSNFTVTVYNAMSDPFLDDLIEALETQPTSKKKKCKLCKHNHMIWNQSPCNMCDEYSKFEPKEVKDSAGNSVTTNSKSSELVPKVGMGASNNAKSGSIPADPKAELQIIRKIQPISLDFKMKRFTPELAAQLITKGIKIGQEIVKKTTAAKLRKILKKRGAIIDDPSHPDGDQSFKKWLKKLERGKDQGNLIPLF